MRSITKIMALGFVASLLLAGCSKDVEKASENQNNLTQKYDDTELRNLISAMGTRVTTVETQSLDNLNAISALRVENEENSQKIEALEDQVKDLQAIVASQTKLIEGNIQKNEEQDLAIRAVEQNLTSRIQSLEDETNRKFKIAEQVVKDLYKRVEAIEFAGKAVLAKVEKRLDKVEVKTSRMKMARIDGFPSVVFDAVNVHIRNGAKHTTTINGLGNLVVGYGERVQDLPKADGTVDKVMPEEKDIITREDLAGVDLKSVDAAGTDLIRFNRNRVGSHNLIVGPYNEYTSYGAVVNGVYNRMRAPFASILGGGFHVNEGIGSVIGGGFSLKTDVDLQFVAESYKWPTVEPITPVQPHPIADRMPTVIRDVFKRAEPRPRALGTSEADETLNRGVATGDVE